MPEPRGEEELIGSRSLLHSRTLAQSPLSVKPCCAVHINATVVPHLSCPNHRDELRALFKVDPTVECDTHSAIKCKCMAGPAGGGGGGSEDGGSEEAAAVRWEGAGCRQCSLPLLGCQQRIKSIACRATASGPCAHARSLPCCPHPPSVH